MLDLRGERRLLRALAAGWFSVVTWLLAMRAAAEGSPAASAEREIRVWYRSSADCPDGSHFIDLLRGFGRSASLASVGDRVDFVVTLARNASSSSGRLERQSTEGTVAIRDYSAARCAEVAEVLALSLDLALRPEAEGVPAVVTPPVINSEGAVSGEATEVDAWERRLGGQGSLETGLAGAVLPGAALFVQLSPAPRAWNARLSLRGAYGERDAAVALQLGLLASRLEACGAWAVSQVTIGPCAAFDVGLLVAESDGKGGRRDAGLWASAVGHLRVDWQVSRLLAVEAQLGLIVPFVRYEFEALTGDSVSGSAAIGFASALGTSFRF